MNKLDSAFDIDPLFHKMSKNFDEGGAKGLLLVNLGLGPNCNIVFDSSGDDIAGEESETPKNDDGDIELVVMEHMTSKLLDPEDVLMDLPLVPQLANLRAQLEGLALEGFFDDGALVDTPSSGKSRRTSAITGRRYAAKDEDEDEADVTIHQEMAERSLRLSTGYPGGYEGRLSSSEGGFGGTPSQLAAKELPDDGDDYAPDDFGGGNDDYDDYGGAELVFDDIEVTNGVCSVPTPSADRRDKAAEQSLFASPSQATSHLLDKISSSSHVLATSDYEFLSARIMKDNAWAGATFWKRKEKRKAKSAVDDSKAEKAAPKKRASRKKKQTKGFVFDAVPDLSDILVKPKKQLLQWSRAVINKHSKEDNLLPLDAGFGVEKLSQLFLRPDMTMLSSTNQDPGQPNKAVEFDPAVETWAPHDDDSFGGGDDDGPGYDFGDDSGDGVRFEEGEASFVVPELKGVRKVEKVHVGYATVAKKVDVKRLKKDLWDELESHFLSPDDMESKTDDHSVPDSTQRASFQTVVHDLESSKSQPDASLPFYFICMLHLANEKGLRLDSKGLGDFDIYPDSLVTGPSF
jgi:condensin complex subunit 2